MMEPPDNQGDQSDLSNRGNRQIPREMSISENASKESSRRFLAPFFLKWLEAPFGFIIKSKSGPASEEAIAWGFDSVARGIAIQAGSFLASAIVILATKEAGCPKKGDCEKSVYGLRPSSLLPVATIIVSLIIAFFMPIFGAIVDYSRYRKTVGLVTSILICLFLGLQLMISQDTWFLVYLFECAGGFFVSVHTTVTLAYLPELTEEEKEITHYISRFTLLQYIFQSFFLVLVVGISRRINAEPETTARIAAAASLGITGLLFTYAWIYLFRKRPALSTVPEGSNLLTSGFRKVVRTCRLIFKDYRPLFWFMLSLVTAPDAGSGVLISIAVTFMTSFLKMTPIQVGIAAVTMLLCTAIGGFFYKYLAKFFNPLHSFRLCLLSFAVSVMLTTIFTSGPEKKTLIYVFAAFWGVSWGLLIPSQRTLYCTISPRGQQTEIMGLFAFANSIIGWLPALVFTTLNENGVNMRLSVGNLSVFLFISFFLTFMIGSYDDAVAKVKPSKSVVEDSFSSGQLEND